MAAKKKATKEPLRITPKSELVGVKLYIVHHDFPQGYEVFPHATEKGAYEDVLSTIEAAVGDMGLDEEDEEDLFAAIKAKDGKAALEAWESRISNDGGDAVHDQYIWVTDQEILL